MKTCALYTIFAEGRLNRLIMENLIRLDEHIRTHFRIGPIVELERKEETPILSNQQIIQYLLKSVRSR